MNAKPTLALVAAVAILPALSACQKPVPAVDLAKETAAINAQIDAFNSAAKARDAAKAVAIDAADIRTYGMGADVTSKDEDLKATMALMADPGFTLQVKPEHTEVAKSGDIAFQTGTWVGSTTNPSTKAVDHATGHWVAAWRKDADRTWRLAAVSTASPAPPEPAADAGKS